MIWMPPLLPPRCMLYSGVLASNHHNLTVLLQSKGANIPTYPSNKLVST